MGAVPWKTTRPFKLPKPPSAAGAAVPPPSPLVEATAAPPSDFSLPCLIVIDVGEDAPVVTPCAPPQPDRIAAVRPNDPMTASADKQSPFLQIDIGLLRTSGGR